MKLIPSDPYDRAVVRGLCEHVNSGMQPLQNLRTSVMVRDKYGGDMKEWCHHWNQIGFESLEKKLEKTAGKFAFGDSPTIADAFIFPQAWGAFTR
jgi:glutathione S-transferase